MRFAKYILALAAVAILGTADAQVFSMGNCDPNIRTVTFDKTQYIGKWYEVRRSYNYAEDGTSCYTVDFDLTENGYNVYGSFIPKHEPKSPIAISFTSTADEENMKQGKMVLSPGFISNEQPFWILATDYNHYGVGYSCMNAYNGKFEFVWIVSRVPYPDPRIMAYAENQLTNNNITLDLIKSVQNCK